MSLDTLVGALRRIPWLGAPLNLLLLLGLAASLAHWTWRFAAPLPPLPANSAGAGSVPEASLASLHAAHLFGAAQGRTDAPAEQATALDLKLRGVFAALGGKAMAIVGGDGQDRAVALGDEVVPGVVLDAIAPDHLILLNRGVRERLDLDALGRPLTPGDGDMPVTRREFEQALADPGRLGVQARVESGPLSGLLLTSVAGDGLAARLGLQSGDTLRMVNGMPVASMQDFARQLSGTAGVQRLSVVGERQGRPLILSYRLQ
ncbi:type II secretion system protein N [Thiobacillus sp. 65-1402]|uniref:type II secretion system protein N n=1 Tax=Thiobacillus sp. 65-1402 TaxID=1895861 RepID=UPI0025D805C9|nr:type II secretion system protein N [Thiobacillus sp. 65-1402]